MADLRIGELFARGKRGLTHLREQEGRIVLVKRRNPRSAVDTIANEAKFNKLLNENGVGPRFISYDPSSGELVREFVEGEELRKWLPNADGRALLHLLRETLRQCKTMDGLKIDKQEMMRPWKNIIVTARGEPVLIDFERCRETEVPKNVTQFCQFLSSSALKEAFARAGLHIDQKAILERAKEYKDALRRNPASAGGSYLGIVKLLSPD